MATVRHRGPNLGVLAAVFVALKLASLFPVTIFGTLLGFKPPYFPAVTASSGRIAAYFTTHSSAVLILAFLQFGAAVPLGIFAATAASQLRYLGVRAAGPYIALFGGLAAAFNSAASACVLWVLSRPGVAQDTALVRALHDLSYAFGGPGYAVPMGLLMAGISIAAGFTKLLPKWVVWLGILLALTGELSWLALVAPRAAFLIPLTRFPGFLWMIAAGFALPKVNVRNSNAPQVESSLSAA